ncbi:MAG: hypothetical protein LBM00_03305 [Deltaproteobacteria bacterium]|jgi:hypothetical protein|nr:hypothetical protein [Deltaproteobacteria bacterium]
MATENLSAQAAESKDLPEWKKERIKMAKATWRNILDPILTFAELVRGYCNLEDGSRVDFNLDEISAVLRILVIGGYAETKLHCNGWDDLAYTCGDSLEQNIKDWNAGTEGGEE